MKHFLFLIAFSAILFAEKSKAQNTLVSEAVKTSFYNSFSNSTKVTWTEIKGIYRADLTIANSPVTVFYNMEGEMIAVAKYVNVGDLSLSLKNDLQAKSNDLELKEIFQVSNDESSNYYATLENEEKIIVLVSEGKHWNVFRKINK